MLSYKQREIRASVDASPGSKGPLAAPTLPATHVSFGQQRANTRAMDDTGHVQVTPRASSHAIRHTDLHLQDCASLST